MKYLLKRLSGLSLIIVLLTGCGGGESQSTEMKQGMRERAKSKTQQQNVSNMYYSLPSPLEIAHVVQTTGVEYESRFLHKVELGVRYSTNMSSALNLGIYGADLSYSIYFDQKQVALNYLDCIGNLSSNLDISDVLTQNKLKEIEENISNKEMLKKIISQTFFHSDALLKENSRRPTAVMVAMGMWIECLYISAQLSESDPDHNPALSTCIVEQGMVFDDLLGLLNTLEDNADVSYLKKELDGLRLSYVNMNTSLGGTFVVSQENGVKYDKKLFADICEKVILVRNNFTQLF